MRHRTTEMRRVMAGWIVLAMLAPSAATISAAEGTNLVKDPSFENTKPRDRWGFVFADWGGWKYEGDCEFQVGRVARTGKTSCLLFGAAGPKIRIAQNQPLEPGRYRITAYLRGLDIGRGQWNMTTEFMFDGKYHHLEKNGTFGWTKLTYVADLAEKKEAGPSFGLWAPGYLWIDDVTLERVGTDVPLTEKPLLGQEEKPVEPPSALGPQAVRCAECGYKNMPEWKTCYACGALLETRQAAPAGPPIRSITSFEDKNPFDGGQLVEQHATDGRRALRIDRSYVCMSADQDWTGYDFLKADFFNPADQPAKLYVEVRDKATTDYWTRVNYHTVLPPGESTLAIPVKQLYVGEKSRPGRILLLGSVTRLVFSIGDEPVGPLFVDHVRLERDDAPLAARFDGLHAFDFGTATSPVMDAFTPVTPATLYSSGRGYGLKNAQIWRSYDVLQPEPLYQDFLCIERGGLAVDVPNGRYRVWLNLDNPSGFWGEYQVYRRRAVLAEGKPVVSDTMDFAALRRKYFRFWNVDDTPADNTFDKYQQPCYEEKTFEVDVADGQLNIEFDGANWACSVSAVVVFPVAKAREGEQFLRFVDQRRRFYFDNYFKRVLHPAESAPRAPTDAETARGYMLFRRDIMQDVYYNDAPRAGETAEQLTAAAFAGEYEPVTLSVLPLKDLGRVRLAVGALSSPAGTIPAEAIDVGFVSYRLSRVTMEGTVYTIAPRLILPENEVEMPRGVTRRWWLTIKTPADAKPGVYRGALSIVPERGATAELPLELTVRAGALDAADIPVGPWGHEITIPWSEGDAEAEQVNRALTLAGLRRLREYGFTTFSGAPTIFYRGFRDGQPVLDFSRADEQMRTARQLGFLAVVSYGSGVVGFNAYYQDAAAMQAAGMNDYAEFVRAIYSAVEKHAEAENWLPVYYNLADEPIGDDLRRSAENAEAYRRAFPQGPPWFTGASSFTGEKADDPHFRLSKVLHVANWNLHDEPAVELLRRAGGQWAFYNGGNRWTFGEYLFKAAHRFDMKFRLSWHWNATAGDPYYALDCREDDYAWCNATPDGRLVPSVEFERLREGLDDYRRLITLERLARAKRGAPAAAAAEGLIAERMGAFRLGQRNHDALYGPDDWSTFRAKVDAAIEALR